VPRATYYDSISIPLLTIQYPMLNTPSSQANNAFLHTNIPETEKINWPISDWQNPPDVCEQSRFAYC
jgi:hypothetical protein